MTIRSSPRRMRDARSLAAALIGGVWLAGAFFGVARLFAATNAVADSALKPATNWALKPLTAPPIPSLQQPRHDARNPIDTFVLSQLEVRGLSSANEADRRVLIRRVTFDLIGLPPTPEEVAAFLNDPAPDAYERLVDRLLASPRHGERWARHWMDAIHFAETHGHDQDRIRTNAWPYRDYLIARFNADTPYARFVQEQVAGDVLFPDDPLATVALGFLAAGPWDESSLRDIREDTLDRQIGRYLDRDDMLTTALQTFTSTTVQCARCHDHKFDPISQQDYYALQAVFAGVDRANRTYDADTAVHRRRRELKRQIARIEPGDCVLLLRQQLTREIDDLPKPSLVYAAASDFVADGGLKPAGAPRKVHLLRRGDITKAQEEAAPGALSCVKTLSARFELRDPADEGARRAALARWLTQRDHPLTWRSIVNRVWQHHFGRGLVETPNDFGNLSAAPSHPELLDWLAVWFRDDAAGSLKQLHRLIVTSATYRQESGGRRQGTGDRSQEAARVDPENRWLARQNRSRLDAEQVRDAILQISGRLDLRMGGPSDQQFDLQPGIHVTPRVDYTKFDVDAAAGRRRGVYRFLFRTLPDPFMDALDCPAGDQLTPTRNASVTVQQALALWNNAFVARHAEHFAARLEWEAAEVETQIERAFALAFSRAPSGEERTEFAEHARRHGLAHACRLLFNANEFMFVD